MTDHKLSTADIARVARRHRGKLIGLPLVVLTLAAGVILFAPRTYRSEGKLLLQIGRESVGMDPTATTGQTINLMQNGRDAEVNSAMDILQSRGVLEQVVDALGPAYILRGGPEKTGAKNPVTDALLGVARGAVKALKSIDPVSPREEAYIKLTKRLAVKGDRDSTVITVQYDAESAKGAQAILEKVIDVYQREHLRVHRNQNSRPFFAEQRDLLERQLTEAQSELRDAKSKMGLSNIESRQSTLEARLQAVELAHITVAQDLQSAEAQVMNIGLQLQNTDEREVTSRTRVPNQGADLLRDQLYELEIKEMDLKSRFSSDHPSVVAIRDQIREARRVLTDQQETREETVDDINPLHRELRAQLQAQRTAAAGFRARLDMLSSQRDSILADLKALNAFEVELSELKRREDVAAVKFTSYAERYEQARLDEQLEEQLISSVTLAQPPSFAEKPVSPSKLLVLLGALMASVGGAAAWVVGSEQLNDRLRDADEAAEMIGLPVFADIPSRAGRVLVG